MTVPLSPPHPPPLQQRLALAVDEGIEANVRRFLAFRGTTEGEPVELQMLACPSRSSSYEENRFAHAFSTADATRLLTEADRVGPQGTYLIFNAIDPAVATRAAAGRWHIAKKNASTSDTEIAARRAVFIDVDSRRPKGTSATDELCRAALEVGERVYHRLAAHLSSTAALGFGHSGNGAAVFIALVSEPETPALKAAVMGVLAAVRELYSGGDVEIDTSVSDAKRLCPAWGTVKRKGAADIADRPHRRTAFVCAADPAPITLSQLQQLLVDLTSNMTPDQRAMVDKVTGARPAPHHAAPVTPLDTPFARANAVDIVDVARRLGLLDGDDVRCPGCGTTGDSSVAFVNNGLKCLHSRCSTLGAPGHSGFRTPVDLVIEVQRVSGRRAVDILADWFGFTGFPPPPPVQPAPAPAPREPGDDTDELTARPETQRLAPHPRGFTKLGISDIFAPLPPVPWLVEALDFCPGAPAMIAGYGYSRKTMAAQALALAIVAGLRVWGQFPARTGRALHIDYEQGRRLTFDRYQRLAVGMGIAPASLLGLLDVVPLPNVYLDSDDAADIYARECEGYDLVLVDSFRAGAPSAEENSSDVRRHLDILTRVAEQTGITPLLIHHARKPSADGKGDARMSLRGSSGIYDACSSILVFSAEKGQPTLVQHEKARTSGTLQEDFFIDVEDIATPTNPRAGLRIMTKTTEQVTAPTSPNAKFDTLKRLIVDMVRDNRDITSANAIAARITGFNRGAKLEAIRELQHQGTIVQPAGEGGAYRVQGG